MNKLRKMVAKMSRWPLAVEYEAERGWRAIGKIHATYEQADDDSKRLHLLTGIAPDLLAVVEAARQAIPEMICTCAAQNCARCQLLDCFVALDAKLGEP